jgi:molecular chaperone Hsp33
MTPEDIIQLLAGDLDVEILDRMPAQYYCNCSKERVSKAVAGVGRQDLQEMIDAGETIEVNCDFCGSHYYFTTEELKEFLK